MLVSYASTVVFLSDKPTLRVDYLPRYPTCLLAYQEVYQAGGVFGLAKPAHRKPVLKQLPVGLVQPTRVGQSGVDRVDGDAFSG